MSESASSTEPYDPKLTLELAVSEIQYMAACVRAWPHPPDVSVVAAWAPILHETLRQIEQRLTGCLHLVAEQSGFKLPDGGIKLQELEESLIRQAMARKGGNQTQAANLLGLSRDAFRYRLEKLGLL